MLSSKLLTMKFMSKSADHSINNISQIKEENAISDSHWRLDFRDTAKKATAPNLEVTNSYTSFQRPSNGRRNFRKDKVEDEEQDPPEEPNASESDEAPEDAYARRQSEKATDNDNLRSMKGMKTLSGNSPNNKRKNKDPQKSKQKKHRQ